VRENAEKRNIAVLVAATLTALCLWLGALPGAAPFERADAAPSVQGGAAGLVMLSGRVYEGNVRDESLPISGVTVSLRGSNDESEVGQILASATTDPTGWYGLAIPANPVYEFYNIVETNRAGYDSVDATSVSGARKGADWIQYAYPLAGKTLTGNKFWDRLHTTRTPTPTRTSVPPTATPTSTRTSVPATSTSTATGIPPTATATATGIPPTRTATHSPTATGTQTGLPPTPTVTGTQTALPPTPTHTRTTQPTPPTHVRITGHINAFTDLPFSQTIPATEVQVALFGSEVAGERGQLLAQTFSAQDGFYALSHAEPGALVAQTFEFLHVVVIDPRYQVVEASSASGGQVTDERWIRFEHPAPGEYERNDFVVRDVSVTPTPTTVAPPEFAEDCLEFLINGDLEAGMLEPWGSAGSVTLGPGYDSAHGVVLGGSDHAAGELWQTVYITAETSPLWLTYWWAAEAAREQPGDWLDVIVQHEAGADRLRTWQATWSLGQWHHDVIDLSAYAGQRIAVTFLVNTDAEVPSVFLVDEARLVGCGAAALPDLAWSFAGAVLWEGEPGRAVRGARVSVYGSLEESERGQRLATGYTSAGGEFRLNLRAYHEEYSYYWLELDDPNYVVALALPGPGGEDYEKGVKFKRPKPGTYLDSQLFAKRSDAPLEVFQPEVVNPWDKPHSGSTVTTSELIDLYILDIEVTQAIQCMDISDGYTKCPDNSLELTSGKPTAVRVYVSCSGCGHDWKSVRVDLWYGSHKLQAVQSSAAILGGSVATQYLDVPYYSIFTLEDLRKDLYDSANFFLTKPTGNWLTVEATVNGDLAFAEYEYHNNVKLVSLPLYNRSSLDLRWMQVKYMPNASATYGQWTGATWANAKLATGIAGRTQKLYPMPVSYSWASAFLVYGVDPSTGSNCTTCPDLREGEVAWDALSSELEDARKFLQPQPDVLIGFVPTGAVQANYCMGWAEPSRGWISPCTTKSNEYLLAHETGHTRDLWHPESTKLNPCWPYRPSYTIQETGFDVLGKTVMSSSNSDFMSVTGQAIYGWISPYHWNRLLKKPYSQQWSTCGSAAATSASGADEVSVVKTAITVAQPEAQPAVWVSGRLFRDGGGELGYLYRFTRHDGFDLPDFGGEYCIDFLDEHGALLAGHCFNASFAATESSTEREVTSFSFLLPWPQETWAVALRRGPELLALRERSPHAPEVVITAPHGGVIDAPTTVSWAAGDADGDPLRFAVLYSHDGVSWTPMAVDIEGAGLEADSQFCAGGESARVQVLASDGFHTAIAESEPFQVPRKPPIASISMPEDGALFDPLEAVVLLGHGDDLEDGEVPAEGMTWESDRQGLLAHGPQWFLAPGTLDPGHHVITLTVTDSNGVQSSESVSVFVGQRLHLPVLLKRFP